MIARADLRTLGYHSGLAVALWCAALMLPPLRSPGTALIALALPAAWFHLRAEFADQARARWRRSAAVATAAVLAAYALRAAFQAVAFPDVPQQGWLYHLNSWLAITLGVLALRQHGMREGGWCGWLGGSAVIVGLFFLVTAMPGLSPFTDPVPAAIAAQVLAHVVIALIVHASPLAALARRLTAADGLEWMALRRWWSWTLLIGAAWATANGVLAGDQPRAVAPLLAGLASVLVHLGVVRRRAGEHIVAAALLALALHADAFVSSWLPLDRAVWAVLVWWAVQAALRARLAPWLARHWSDRLMTALAGVVALHVAWHRPWSSIGLAAVALAAVNVALTPRDDARAVHPLERCAAWALPLVPAWLAFWMAARLGDGVDLTRREPWLVLGLAVAGIGHLAHRIEQRWSAEVLSSTRANPLIADQSARVLAMHGIALARWLRWIASVLAVAALAFDRQRPAPTVWLIAQVALSLALAADWFACGRRERSMLANVVGQVLIVAAVVALRRQLLLTTTWWRLEYDVWTTLIGSVIAAGIKQIAPRDDRAAHLPLAATLLLAPAFALAWTVGHGLGTDLALVVIALHSAIFAWLGREERDSPYHVIAVAGAVSFVLVVFAGKLGLRAAHAYIIPPCLGVLLLDQLFAARTDARTRAGVRMAALAAMLGSSGWYALADASHPVAFHGVFIGIGLAVMIAGAALRVRLYLAAGFVGVVVDLFALVARVLIHADRGARVAGIGALVLLAGAALVGGAIFYKVHREAVDRRLTAWRERLARWE